jgi:hypothetical protein
VADIGATKVLPIATKGKVLNHAEDKKGALLTASPPGPKMLFFGSRCERLCMMQFSLISLIPGLLRNLQDCAGPELNNYEEKLSRPTSLRTSDRNSLLSYMGLPLQIFGKVSSGRSGGFLLPDLVGIETLTASPGELIWTVHPLAAA